MKLNLLNGSKLKKFLKALIIQPPIQKEELCMEVEKMLEYYRNKNGIEIGGPSPIFKSQIPIYEVINSLDGCNFSANTVWEGTLKEGQSYNFFQNKKGVQYICEASNLKNVENYKYDFLIASHCLEHCANTLKTFKEWLRVLKEGGSVLLILPDKRYTFDHKRPITKFKHFEEDYKNNIEENDLTHLCEIINSHDLSMDIPAGSIQEFKKRSLNNFNNRCLHHHLFDFDLLKELFESCNVQLIETLFLKPHHQIILGIKK